MKLFSFLLLASVLSFSCSSSAEKTNTEQTDSEIKTSVETVATEQEAPKSESPKEEEVPEATKDLMTKKFTFDRADLHHYVEVTWTDDKTIEYELYMVSGSCKEFKKSGKATTISSDNVETDEDQEGNTFVVNEYIDDSSDCWVSIRIGAEKGAENNAKFILADCKANPCGESQESEALRYTK